MVAKLLFLPLLALPSPLPKRSYGLVVPSSLYFLQSFVGCVFQALGLRVLYFLHRAQPPPLAPASPPCVAPPELAAGFPPPRFRSLVLRGMASVEVFILPRFPAPSLVFNPIREAKSLSNLLCSLFWSQTLVNCEVNLLTSVRNSFWTAA